MSSKNTSNRLFTVHFVKERETKGAVRYQEVASDTDSTPVQIGYGAKVGTLYIRKPALGAKPPRRIAVRVAKPA
jgi:hypothetical protein